MNKPHAYVHFVAVSEILDHVLIHCQFAQVIWNKIRMEFDLISVLPSSWHDLLAIEWCFKGNNKKAKMLWRCCCMAAAWSVWQERNARIFEDRLLEVQEVWGKSSHWLLFGHSLQEFLVHYLFLKYPEIGVQL